MNPAPFAYPQTAQLDEALGLPSQLAATGDGVQGRVLIYTLIIR